MSKDVINLHGQDVVVREDTAKAFHGVRWATISIFAFAAIAALLWIFIALLPHPAKEGTPERPSRIQNSNAL